jgi:UDPglucose--hexose-1-phosphate uridylyltransferase
MKLLCEYVLDGKSLYENETLEKHAAWFDSFKDKYTFTKENVEEIVFAEIGNTFVNVLCDAGVYKCTEEGRAHFSMFCDYVNNNL